jgi:hypothetical protein
LEVKWGENCRGHQVKRLIPGNIKQTSQAYKVFSGINSHHGQIMGVVEIWKRFKETVFESVDSFVPNKILRKNPDP